MATKFKPGDLVQLKAGGPKMVVETWVEYVKAYECTWFAGAKHNSERFKEAVLQPYEEPNK